jgi:1-acyl-sn-glycerol-3-phosphate acyltransferase
MGMSVNYLWRWCGTALCFFLFGFISFLVWAILFPLVSAFLGAGVAKKRRSRYLMHWVLRCYIELMRVLGLLSYQVGAAERLNRPGRLIVANHPSLIDVVFLISLTRNATCIVKPALMGNPFMRIPIRAVGYVYADDPKKLMDVCAEELQEGSSLIIFPEGTRTTPGQPFKFQRGAANIALKSGAKILPVHITCTPTTLTKQEKWYQIPPKKVLFRLQVGDEIDPCEHGGSDKRSIAARRLTEYLEQCFLASQPGQATE